MNVSRAGLLTAVVAALLATAGVLGAAAQAPDATASDDLDQTTTTTGGDATLVTDGEQLVLQPEPDQTIRGETTVEPGTDLSVRVQGDQFIKTFVVTVTEDGTFSVTLDLSSAHGSDLEITVRRGDATLLDTSGRVACAGGCETETTAVPDPAVTTTATDAGDLPDLLTGGVGLIALGGALAVVGIGVVLGIFRS